jgi:class 3 adenylate cyclase
MVQATAEPALKPAESNRLEALAEYLRDHAEESLDSADLSHRFGLEERFVTDVVRMLTVDAVVDAPTFADTFKQGVLFARTVTRRINAIFRSWTSDPIKFVLYTGGFCMIALWLSQILGGSRFGVVGALVDSLYPLLFLCTLPLHLMCFFRHGRLRFPLYSAAVLGLALVPAMTPTYLQVLADTHGQRWQAIGVAAFTDVAYAGSYAFLGGIASLLGGYFQVQRDDRRDRRLGRQELLERLFRMQARLAQVSAEPQGLARRMSRRQRIWRSPLVPVASFLAGAGYSLITWIIVSAATANMSDKAALTAREGLFALANLAAIGGIALFGYMGGRPLKAILNVFLALGGSLVVIYLPLVQSVRLLETPRIEQMLFLIFIGFFAGAGALVEDRTFSKSRLREDDPAFLLAEMIRIQRRLKRGRRATCVMMVDVARSTAMKSDRDQFDVEYSFRRYHQLVELIAGRHRGEVVSTAGDGAVVVFDQADHALRAAKEIQSEISRFNVDVNRLHLPFNLRIGIHCGETDSELHQAPFNELIDVAAHVQAMSPVGGIALTEAATENLEGERLAEITDLVDGHKVHISLDPVLVG